MLIQLKIVICRINSTLLGQVLLCPMKTVKVIYEQFTAL